MSKSLPLPPLSRLRELFSYDPETGIVARIAGRGVKIGEPVGAKVDGRLQCRCDYRFLYVHRIAWALYYGEEPPEIIDHVNGDGTDNRIKNLRAATNGLNRANSRASRNNSTGIRGVSWSARHRRFRSSLKINGQNVWIGHFKTKEEALAAYRAAADKHFGAFSYYNRQGGGV